MYKEPLFIKGGLVMNGLSMVRQPESTVDGVPVRYRVGDKISSIDSNKIRQEKNSGAASRPDIMLDRAVEVGYLDADVLGGADWSGCSLMEAFGDADLAGVEGSLYQALRKAKSEFFNDYLNGRDRALMSSFSALKL